MEFKSNLDEILKKYQQAKQQTLKNIGTFCTAEAQTRATVKTGNMRRNTTYTIPNQNEVDIGCTVEAPYAPYVEKGTYKMKAQPFIEPSVMENISRIGQIAGQSFHINMGGES